LGLVAVLLTASRGGFLAAVVALAGCVLLLTRGHAKRALAAALALPVLAVGLWFAIPRETFDRLATIPSQLQSGDLNQRLNIWDAGWHAFVRSPIVGSGAGSFTSAAGTNPLDTAHNTALSILVGGGLCALALAVAIAALAARAALQTRGPIRLALTTALLVWGVASLVDTVEENRTTWLLLGLVALAARLAAEEPKQLEECFADVSSADASAMVPGLASRPVN
jgi:O-antigen ligase